MSRTVAAATKAEMFGDSSPEAFLTLVTLTHPDFDATIRWVDNTENVTSNGNVYTAFPFRVVLPDDSRERGPRARLQVDNVSREIMAEVRTIGGRSRIKATLQVIMASDPDTAVATYDNFELRNIQYNEQTVSGDLTLSDFLEEPYPGNTFNPADFPALF